MHDVYTTTAKMHQAPLCVELVHETTGSADFTDASTTTCGLSVTGEILTDQDTQGNLEQVS
jgi:hypothetical protein